MKRSERRSEDAYEPYLTKLWPYIVIFLLCTLIALFLGWEFGR